ncbi:MAG: DNA double-strand break repair nuclease NurA [Candidatus Woesearchaeota archaeon]|nr:DNA double-strand break repair nuclease NurA [Candidatus Woesearchaeota archaeon]MDP7181656.1 DNA double-strand break repair nuclease NurA [Candidatus Woesearchaeota archaeon]MDP7198745.1 DNA double-strand break repair nuclease NurA [Candidatus Woesearchaeota archaeon]MDP7467255.1 DNA double-strand break repair nuclease NurA [Candidatus Woesearchaeota archaeon]MDP7647410.1 DNA double-strand break repair nuclease NurA [Candidatus Woesearchaeota archaeon]
MKLFEQEPGKQAHLNGAIPFDKENFQDLKLEERKIAYIDGGNAEISGGANYSVQLLRTYATIWGKERLHAVRKENPLVVQSQNKEGMQWVSTSGSTFDFNEKGLMQGQHTPTPASVADHLRRIAELKLALEVVQHAPDIIVLDGNLETSTPTEANVMDTLKRACQQHNILLIGLAKTTSLVTDTGMGLPDALMQLTQKKSWVYHPITSGMLSMVKLHERGSAYRMDGPPEAAHALAAHAKDAAFPGYPYPLIEADQLARITQNETLRYKLLLENTKQANDAHDVLNIITGW